jgi:hypothetical protein
MPARELCNASNGTRLYSVQLGNAKPHHVVRTIRAGSPTRLLKLTRPSVAALPQDLAA